VKASEVEKRWSTDQLIMGIETPDWVKLLQKNKFRVDSTYAHRAAWISAWSLPITMAGRLEDATYGRQLASMELKPTPVFVLGHWRSGTTHLHNLLGRAPGNTYPNVMQVVFPTCFLVADKVLPTLLPNALGDTRTYDNVKQGWHEAAEDEIALAKLTGMSPYISFMFPENVSKYERYIDFMEVAASERDKWKQSFLYFLKKISLQTGGDRIIVKSCTHTARIRMLLEMFPDAKFVHNHRHPYEVYASTLHMRSHTDWENFFQLPETDWTQERKRQTLQLGQRIFERVIEDRHLIPPENFLEIKYEDLCGNELSYVRRIYEQFDLGRWAETEKALTPYVEGLKGYQRNKLKITADDMDEVYHWWRSVFDAYGYDRDYAVEPG
jgi:hypothetical protein